MFPAFNYNVTHECNNKSETENQTWLTNTTFHEQLAIEAKAVDEQTPASPSSDSSDSYQYEKKKKKRKLSKERSHNKEEKYRSKKTSNHDLVELLKKKSFLEDLPDLAQEEAFIQDKRRDRSIYQNAAISSRLIPKYYSYSCPIIGMKKPLYLQSIPHKHRLKTFRKSRYFYRKNIRIFKNKPQSQFIKENMKPPPSLEMSSIFIKLPSASATIATPDTEPVPPVKSQLLDRIAQCNRDVADHPRNIDYWLQLIDVQSDYISATANVKSKDQLHKMIVDKQLSIVTNALQKNAGNLILMLKQLELGEQLSQTDLMRTWNQLTFAHPEKVFIWRLYLNYMCRNSAQFTTSKVSQAFAKCFTILTKIMCGKVLSHKPQSNCATEIIDLFSMYCKWLRHCGFTERAMASWQALIEFSCYRPGNRRLQSGCDLAEDPLILDFEKFWDSEVERFGEPGATGWQIWYQTGTEYKERAKLTQSIDERYSEMESSILTAGSLAPPDKMWCPIELLREKFYWLPWTKPSEEANDVDDPDRMVLFDEIRCCLLDFSGVADNLDVHNQILCRIILMFLEFLGLKHHLVGRDGLTTKDCAVLSDLENILPPSSDCHKHLQFTTPENKSYSIIIQNVLSQSLSLFNDASPGVTWMVHSWNSYLSCLELSRLKQDANSIKSVMKQGKSILQRDCNRNDLTVWSAYAQVLDSRGAPLESRKILDTALCHFPLEDVEDWPDVATSDLDKWKTFMKKLSLIETFISIELGGVDSDLNSSTVSSLLLYSVSGGAYSSETLTSPQSALQVLKIQHALNTKLQDYWKSFNNLCRTGSLPSSTGTRFCVILRVLVHLCAVSSSLNFLSQGDKVLSEEIVSFSARLNQSPIQTYINQEEIVQCRSDFILQLARLHSANCRITQQESYLMRSILLTNCSLNELSRDPQLLQFLFPGRCEKSIPLSTVMSFRQSINNLLKSENSFPIWYLILDLEERRWSQTADGLMDSIARNNRLRSLYEQALESKMFLKANINVRLIWWGKYLKLESTLCGKCSKRTVASQQERLKSVFYRSIQQCPGAKSFYLSYVEAISENLSEVMDILVEREIRIRAPAEEIELLLTPAE